jgi:hypothetical protein
MGEQVEYDVALSGMRRLTEIATSNVNILAVS